MSAPVAAAATSAAGKLRKLLAAPGLIIMPCCYDGLSARLIERAGFRSMFMSGFGVSATHGLPDTQLLGYAEMKEAAQRCASAVDVPIIADGDTGYGNAINTKRTIAGYFQAGVACIMIEDQVAPKRCGHTKGKQVVPFDEATARIQAAVDARTEKGLDILIMARTDARAVNGFEDAVSRCKAFVDIGADLTFLEAPQSIDEMERYCSEVPGYKMANMLENGVTPVLPADELERIGFKIAAYPFALLNASIVGMESALNSLKAGNSPTNLTFKELQDIVGFTDYFVEEKRYSTK